MKAKEKYNEIKTMLKDKRAWGDIKIIAGNLKKNPVYVSSILSPANNLYNEKVFDEALKLITEREKNTDRIVKKLGGGKRNTEFSQMQEQIIHD